MTGSGMEAWRQGRGPSARPNKTPFELLPAILIEKYEGLKE
jgi:hypothetical protein